MLTRLAAVAVAAFCIQIFSSNQADVDLWGNVHFVRAPAWSPDFHRVNTFSFTEPDHSWINHEWLAEYVFNRTHALFGNAGLLGLKVLLGLLMIGLMNLVIRHDCRSGMVRFLWLFLVVSVLGFGFNMRPHLFSFAMVAGFMVLLRRRKFGWGFLVTVPLLGLIWVNLHGAFFMGLVLMAVFLAGEMLKKVMHHEDALPGRPLAIVAGALGLFLAVSLANPYGFALWRFVAESAATFRPYLTEWAPFDPRVDLAEHADFVVLSVLVIAGLVFTRERRDPVWVAVLLITFVAALMMRRNIPLFALVAGFAAARHVDSLAGERLSQLADRISMRALAVGVALFIPLSAFYTVTFNKVNPLQIEIPRNRYPVEIMAFLENNAIEGNVLLFFDWAEYGISRLYPRCRVFLDGRFTDAYDITTVNDYFNFLYAGRGWEAALQRYPADIVLIHRQLPVYREMVSLPGWELVVQTDLAALFMKTEVHAGTLDRIRRGELKMPVISGPVYFP